MQVTVRRILKAASIVYVLIISSFLLIFHFSNFGAYIFKDPNKLIITTDRRVQIWSKAAIGQYLWSHILNGTLSEINNGFYQLGNVTYNGITFDYFSGPGYIQTTLPQNVNYLILVLNGRTVKRSSKAKEWLDYLIQLRSLRKLAVFLLGSEDCEDDWIVKYLKSKGGIIDLLFIIYDSPLVDDKEVFQWPLGVATYRGFPKTDPTTLLQETIPRKYVCNFMGTVYKNSSREKLVELMSNSYFKQRCYFETRNEWLPNETTDSLQKYIRILSKSMITLSPAGKNLECYRIYEAISLGSIPVLVMEPNHGRCVNPPLRLLNRHEAPIIKFSSWEEAIETITSSQINLTSSQLLSWYSSFKKELAFELIDKIKNVFFLN